MNDFPTIGMPQGKPPEVEAMEAVAELIKDGRFKTLQEKDRQLRQFLAFQQVTNDAQYQQSKRALEYAVATIKDMQDLYLEKVGGKGQMVVQQVGMVFKPLGESLIACRGHIEGLVKGWEAQKVAEEPAPVPPVAPSPPPQVQTQVEEIAPLAPVQAPPPPPPGAENVVDSTRQPQPIGVGTRGSVGMVLKDKTALLKALVSKSPRNEYLVARLDGIIDVNLAVLVEIYQGNRKRKIPGVEIVSEVL